MRLRSDCSRLICGGGRALSKGFQSLLAVQSRRPTRTAAEVHTAKGRKMLWIDVEMVLKPRHRRAIHFSSIGGKYLDYELRNDQRAPSRQSSQSLRFLRELLFNAIRIGRPMSRLLVAAVRQP